MSEPLREALGSLLLAMADDEVLLGHRDAEWVGHAPILEADIAMASIAQDEIGHAILWYSLLHELGWPDPDRMAYFRDPPEFRNATLVELPRGDWAFTVVRQFLFDYAEKVRLEALMASAYRPLAEAAAKVRREETYHLMHSRAWVVRLGDATEESHRRMQAALDLAWPHALGLFEPAPGEDLRVAEGIQPPEAELRARWEAEVRPILEAASLVVPEAEPIDGGRKGQHTAHLAALLADFQMVARSGVGETW
ncbi:1,2-phenylacetyl-CoA epoxidase subunit PaaC [Thermoflexus sp.]|uniref:1,2-phenylacetyl-CoA epoxidase subunit PaaC n=1 Tax=Thermoflexus sp. TaxID=1969742 RepID=UPI0035E43F97